MAAGAVVAMGLKRAVRSHHLFDIGNGCGRVQALGAGFWRSSYVWGSGTSLNGFFKFRPDVPPCGPTSRLSMNSSGRHAK